MGEGAVVGRKGLIESCPAAGCLQQASPYRFILMQREMGSVSAYNETYISPAADDKTRLFIMREGGC